jgi:thymidylate kinase
MFIRRRMRTPRGLIPRSGGAVIAFVGPEATGKSTLISEIRSWLGEHFAVEQIHAGKPKASLLGMVPKMLMPAMRAALPSYRSSHVEAEFVSEELTLKQKKVFPLIFGIRAVLLAYDRRTLLTRAFRHAANGNLVLCDRYPNQRNGTPDSPQLSHLLIDPERHPVRRWLANLEDRLYQEIPPADLVISLSVPVEVALVRNRTRDKKEPEDYLRRRHAISASMDFGRTPLHKINTDQSFENSVLEAKKAIWMVL